MSDEEIDSPKGTILSFPARTVEPEGAERAFSDVFGDLHAMSHEQLLVAFRELVEKADFMQAVIKGHRKLLETTVVTSKNAVTHIRALESTLETISKCLASAQALPEFQRRDRDIFVNIAREACGDLDASRWPEIEWPNVADLAGAEVINPHP